MRGAVAVVLGLVCVAGLGAQGDDKAPPPRYGVAARPGLYPQGTPKEALDSVLKAVERQRVDYLLAHLADPDFVDKRVRDYGGKFAEVVKETQGNLTRDPTALKQLARMLREGEWEDGESAASAGLKDGRDRVFFRKIDNRWFLENRKRAAKDKAEK